MTCEQLAIGVRRWISCSSAHFPRCRVSRAVWEVASFSYCWPNYFYGMTETTCKRSHASSYKLGSTNLPKYMESASHVQSNDGYLVAPLMALSTSHQQSSDISSLPRLVKCHQIISNPDLAHSDTWVHHDQKWREGQSASSESKASFGANTIQTQN